jgi:hypothetical protein
MGGRLEAETDAAQRMLDAAVYVLAPHFGRLDEAALTSETARTLAAGLARAGTLPPTRDARLAA